MKSQSTKYRVLTSCLAPILLAGIVPSIAAAGTPKVTHYRFSGFFADLNFDGTSDSVESYVGVYAAQSQGQNPGNLFINAAQYDSLTNSYSCYYGSVPLTGPQFQVSNSLQSASLEITGVVLDDCDTGQTVATADLSLNWTSSGGPSNGFNSTNRFIEGVFLVRARSSGLERTATVAGSVVINGTNFLAGTPSPDFTYADVGKYRYSEVDIMKKPF
jgi:hypothetical protein